MNEPQRNIWWVYSTGFFRCEKEPVKPSANANHVRIGCRFNSSPHEHRDKHTGTFLRSEGLPAGWYQARARLEADRRAELREQYESG